MFPWAKYRTGESAIKLHTLLELRGNIPSIIIITDGKGSEFCLMDEIPWQAESTYLMDRGYLDYARLYNITKSGAFFVIRLRKRVRLRRLYSHKVSKETGLIYDQTVVTSYYESVSNYPTHLRRVKFFDKETNKTLEFLTNNFDLPALTIARLYKQRWQIELFFKWIKQHLRIKAFFGTSENAVKTQIWIAISTYLLIAIIKKTLKLDESLYTLSQIFSLSLFERTQNLSDFIKESCTDSETEVGGLFSLLGS
jgi:IS4 transposase